MVLTPSQIHAELEEHPRWRRTLAVTVPGAIVRAEVARAVGRLAGRIKLPGFRKGKAPSSVVEGQHGPALQQEAVQRLVEQASRAALARHGLHAVSDLAIEGVDYRSGSDLTFRASFDVRPVVELTCLDGFVAERPTARVGEQDIAQALERVREDHAIWRPPDDDQGRPGDGDLVTVRIVPAPGAPDGSADDVGLPWARRLRLRPGSEHRGRYQLVLGGGDALPALEDAIRSLVPGTTADVTLPSPGPGGENAEKRLRVTLQERQVRELPELDDAFVRSLGDFDGLDALRERIALDLAEEATARAEAVLHERLLDAVLEANPFEVPSSMVERYLGSLAPGTAPAVEVEALRPQAERLVKRFLVLDRLAQLHDLRATEAEVDARVAEIAAGGFVPADRVRAQLVATNRLDELTRAITDAKAFDFLKRRSEIREGQ